MWEHVKNVSPAFLYKSLDFRQVIILTFLCLYYGGLTLNLLLSSFRKYSDQLMKRRNSFFFFFFLPHCSACGILVPNKGLNPGPRQWTRQVLSTGPPGNSPEMHSFKKCIKALELSSIPPFKNELSSLAQIIWCFKMLFFSFSEITDKWGKYMFLSPW